LLSFNQSYRRRNKLGVPFKKEAKCETFLNTLMIPALDSDDLDLLQRACGLFLIGKNLAQKILLLIGTAGGGKGTFIRILSGIIGLLNVAALRTQLLTQRFEIGRFLGKTLLYGADAPAHFLNTPGASVLKALVGGDPTTFEFKGSNERPNIVCFFNVVISCNSRLVVHLEGDAEAWRRRLVSIDYHNEAPENVIADLSDQILAKEAPGVLNWMLEGLDKIRAAGWQLSVTEDQQKRVDNLLLESNALALFVDERLVSDPNGQVTVAGAYAAFVSYCNEHEWQVLTRKQFGSAITDAVVAAFSIPARHDIKIGEDAAQRGWKGISLL
jgi:P4 family phage/plasmid primase-like protien